MKRTMKKIVAFALAAVMMLAMTATAFAAEVQVNVEADSTHTFKAYQIFSGTQAKSDDGSIDQKLGDVEWGSGVKATELMEKLKEQEAFKACKTAADVADVLGKYTSDSDGAKAFAKVAYNSITDDGTELHEGANSLPEGYYLIVDTTDLGDGDAANAALLQVTGNEITIKAKTDKPSVEKKVQENTKYNEDGGYDAGYNDVADYNIGDTVPFAFYSTVPDMTYYDTYKFVLHDTMDKGLSFDSSSVEVTIGTNKIDASAYSVKTEGIGDGCTFEIVFEDLKKVSAAAGDKIRVDFTATLNADAVVGLSGNVNTVYLEYSNKPNEPDSTGKTPEDKVIVFTYELDGTKVDGATLDETGKIVENTTLLKDAEFKLYRMNGDAKEYVVVDGVSSKVQKWVPEKMETLEGEEVNTAGSIIKSAEDGSFKISGLDDGTYYLEETKAPEGYNKLAEPIKVVVTAATANGQNWTGESAGSVLTELNATVADVPVTGDHSVGTIPVVVANNSGALLPSTGGIGTTIFYVVGILVMAGAVFFLAMSRRKKED